MSIDPTTGSHVEFGQFGTVVQVPCGRKKKDNQFMPDLPCEQSLIRACIICEPASQASHASQLHASHASHASQQASHASQYKISFLM